MEALEVSTDVGKENIDTSKHSFLNIVNRGGLLKPSDILYMSCMYAWSYFAEIMDGSENQKLFLKSQTPLTVFVESLTKLLSDTDHTSQVVNAKCGDGHSFSRFLKETLTTFFNCMATNFVSERNSEIHAEKKRKQSDEATQAKRSSEAMKIAKVSSIRL